MMRLLAPRHDHPAYSDRVVTRLASRREIDRERDQQDGGYRKHPFHSVNRSHVRPERRVCVPPLGTRNSAGRTTLSQCPPGHLPSHGALALQHRDPDFHQHDVAAALAQTDTLRNMARTGNGGKKT